MTTKYEFLNGIMAKRKHLMQSLTWDYSSSSSTLQLIIIIDITKLAMLTPCLTTCLIKSKMVLRHFSGNLWLAVWLCSLRGIFTVLRIHASQLCAEIISRYHMQSVTDIFSSAHIMLTTAFSVCIQQIHRCIIAIEQFCKNGVSNFIHLQCGPNGFTFTCDPSQGIRLRAK